VHLIFGKINLTLPIPSFDLPGVSADRVSAITARLAKAYGRLAEKRPDGITNCAAVYRELVESYEYRVLDAFRFNVKGVTRTLLRGADKAAVFPPETEEEIVSIFLKP
jgi:hypothetical protein